MKKDMQNGIVQFFALLAILLVILSPLSSATFDGDNEQDVDTEKTRESTAGSENAQGGDSEEEGTPITIATPPPSSARTTSSTSGSSSPSVPYGIGDPNMIRDLSGKQMEAGAFAASLFSGAATYAYSIEVPPAVNGLQPEISLAYNHQAAASRGPAGNGWALSTGAILRDTNGTLADTSDDEFWLSFMGGTSKLVYDRAEDLYHTEVESYWNIRKQGDSWEVRMRDGTLYRFGAADDAKLSSTEQSFTSVWSLDLVNDTHGNQIAYSYDERLGGDYYPYLSEISYNGALAKVQFLYEPGSINGTEGYLHGTRVNQTALLQDINVLYNLTLVRRIHLGYANREAARLLRNITLIGRDNRSALPPIKFEYATPPSGWAQNSSFALPQGVYLGEQKDLGVRFLDVNADGFDDLLRMTDTSTLESWLNTKSGWERQENISGFLQGGFVERYGQDRGVRFFDIDGDAATDIIKLSRDGNVTTLIKANGRDRWTEKQVSFPENVSFVIGKAEPACVPASCPSGTTQTGDACVSGLCSRTCEYQYCSSSGTLVLDSSSNSQPEWNDNDHDEEDWGETFTPSSNKCYKFEFTGSEQTDSDDSQCYDLYTDNDNSRNLYSRDCNGRDIDAYAGVGFVGSRSSSTWLRTVDGGADYGYIGNQDNSYWEYRYLSKYDVDGSPDTSGSNEGDWDGFNDLVCDEGGTQAIYCAPSDTACALWGNARCGTGCAGETTRPFVVIGVYADYNNNLYDALADNWFCGDIDDNDYFGYHNKYRVTEYQANTASVTNTCEYIPYVYNATGTRLGDVNGDGNVDLLQAADSTSRVWLNNGSGFATSSWSLPGDSRFLSAGKDAGARIVDVNGDGLPDLVKGNDSVRKTWLNRGDGWQEDAVWTLPAEAAPLQGGADAGIAFIDVNGDGLVDILRANATDKQTWLNTGKGWTPSPAWSLPSSANFRDASTAIVDVNGDGLPDIITAKSDAERRAWTNAGQQANLLSSIRNGQGGTLSLAYSKMSGKNNTGSDRVSDLPFSGWVIDTTTLDNGLSGDFGVVSTTRYSYSGGMYDPPTREFRGFAEVTEQRPDGAQIVHRFHQDAARKGLEYETSLSAGGKPYTKIELSFDSSVNHSSYVVRLSSADTSLFDGVSPSPTVTRSRYAYDSFGNVVEAADDGNLDVSGDERVIRTEYIPDASRWILGLPRRQKVSGSHDEKLRETYWSYNSAGDLTEETRYLDAGNTPITSYSYDSFGNLISAADPLGQETTWSYDDSHMFPVSETNALHQRASYTYDPATGAPLSLTDSNVYTTRWGYDVFGRLIQEFRPSDSVPSLSYNFSLDGRAPEQVTVWTSVNSSSSVYQATLLDGLGQAYAVIQQADAGNLTTQTRYDALGRIIEVRYPSNASEPRLVALEEYDSLGRVLKHVNPDNTSREVAYDHLKSTLTDENGHKTEQVQDAFGEIVSVTEFLGNRNFTTRYNYSPLGELLSIRDSKGSVFSYAYDALGRKIRMKDPDLGTWAYAYDLAGNLIRQTDARNVTTTLGYDGLGRITEKSAAGTRITYTYDTDVDGTLSAVDAGAWRKSFEYDDRLRLTKETLSIDGNSFVTSYQYDNRDAVAAKTLPDRSRVSYIYSKEGRLASIPGIVSMSYTSAGLPAKRVYRNQLETSFSYDFFRVSSLSTAGLQDFGYAYDAKGNLLEIRDDISNVTSGFAYDSLDRLTNASRPGNYSLSYRYDDVGNLLNVTGSGFMNVSYVYGTLAHSPSYLSLDYAAPRILSASAAPGVQGFGESVRISASTEHLNLSDSGFIAVDVVSPAAIRSNLSVNGTGQSWSSSFSGFTVGIHTYQILVGDMLGSHDASEGTFEVKAQINPQLSAADRCYPDETLPLDSRLRNAGETNASAYIILSIERLNGSSWVPEATLSSRWERVLANASLNLSSRWTPWSCGNASRVPGSYRVTLRATDGQGSVLVNSDASRVEAFDTFELERIPAILNVSTPNASQAYGFGKELVIEALFNKPVMVTGNPSISLNAGRQAVYVSGSGTSKLSFAYTVGSGANAARLEYTNSSALSLNNGSILDAHGKNALLRLPSPGGAGSLGARSAIIIDTMPPELQFALDRGEGRSMLLKPKDNLDSSPTISVKNLTLKKKVMVRVHVEDDAGNSNDFNYTQAALKGFSFAPVGNALNYSHTAKEDLDLDLLSVTYFNGERNSTYAYQKNSRIFSTPIKAGVTLEKDAQASIVKKSKTSFVYEEEDYTGKKMRTVRTAKYSSYKTLLLATQGQGFNATVIP